jgi:hypothetical protein
MKTINLRAPKSMKLNTMSAADVEAFVAKEAGRLLDAMPKEVRPVGVNAVAIDSVVARTAADPGVWVQWTRACCDRRKQIEDFIEPVVADFDPTAQVTRASVAGQHVESLMRTETLANPKMHGKRGGTK